MSSNERGGGIKYEICSKLPEPSKNINKFQNNFFDYTCSIVRFS